MKWVQDFIRVFRVPSADVMAQQQLEETRRELLIAQANREHYTAMVSCLTEREKRLAKRVEDT